MVKSRTKAGSMAINLLSIAGYDPSGGAGVHLDIRVFEHLGFRGYGILTSVTAQNTAKLDQAVPLSRRLVRAQYDALTREVRFAGIKVGMAGSLENLAEAARILGRNPSIPSVVDPVFRSSSGARLVEAGAIPVFLKLLRGKATLITPNLDEASALTWSRRIGTLDGMKEAARRIFDSSGVPCLVKGGHLEAEAVDVLYDGGFRVFRHARIGKSVHGTGCFLSAAILGYLAEGHNVEEACRRGIALTALGIRRAVPAGKHRMAFTFPVRRRKTSA
jgi:hydroxymethylpyrimidine/phosphomethylpyrimidine kinase